VSWAEQPKTLKMNRVNRSSWLAAIGIVVAIVALWRPGVSVSSGPGYRLALNLPEWLLIPLAVAAVAMCLAMITVRRKHPDGVRPPPSLRLSPAGILLLSLFLAGAIPGARLALHLLNPDMLTSGQNGPLPEVTSNPAGGPDAIDVPVLDVGVTIALFVFAVLLTGFALLLIAASEPWAAIAQLFRPRGRKGPQAPQELASAISAGMRELELGGDPRSAVIVCYRRCEAALAAQRRRRLSETPREFMRGALAALALPANAVRALLLVFERARFSDLPVTEIDRSVALDSLDEIRSALIDRSEDGSRA
jgi:Domain of unknown function (DUF4129)